MEGVFAINKPMGMSSAQVIRDCQHHFNPSEFFRPMVEQDAQARARESNTKKKRRKFKQANQIKIGHGGTLDPLATGVLILGIGKGTKSLQSFLDCTKSYETTVLFGVSTDTYDRVGKVLTKTGYDHITRPMVEEALDSFRGKFSQMPPLYSALKMEGKPLYEYAREGKALPREIPTREVEVTELEIVEWYDPGEHSYRWPVEEASTFEKQVAESVWNVEKRQMASKKLTPEEEKEEYKALNDHESFKRKADESVDALVYDKLSKRRKAVRDDQPMMSGALGDLPAGVTPRPGKGSNLVPPLPSPSSPSPWTDKGPPAAKIRMTVTSGFYVRSFCHDLGTKVGSSAIMMELSRSRQRDFVAGSPNCLEFSALAEGEKVWGPQLKSMLHEWNNRDTNNSSQPAPNRARPNTSEETRSRAERAFSPTVTSASPSLSKGNKVLPTPDKSSPARNEKARDRTPTRNASSSAPERSSTPKKASDEERQPAEADNKASAPSSSATEAAATSEEKPVPPTPAREAGEEKSGSGFSDPPEVASSA